MNYDRLNDWLGRQAFFDLATVVQFSREARHNVRVQLHRWVKQGKLLSLRRGFYAWPNRRQPPFLNPAELANALHRPSYLSGLWALSYYGLIPEKTTVFTSVTTRAPCRFENAVGLFEYRHVKAEAFFGYSTLDMADAKVLVARPEKALLDFWHLSKGAWSEDRMTEMRFQNVESVRERRLEQFARRFHSPRLLEAVRMWKKVAEDEREGTVIL